MRNLLIFISKYNAFFFFVFFFAMSLILVFKNNSFQRASTLNSSNLLIGQAYERYNTLQKYLRLAQVSDSLAAENARLRSQLKNSFYQNKAEERMVNDTTTLQQYTYLVAQVVNNSIHQKNNSITIDKGRSHGILPGMGVICSSGIVGIVDNVSTHYATIKSLLHQDTRISARITETQAFGSLVWGQEDYNPRIATLKDIPNHVDVKRGHHIVTSGYSALFPAGIAIGRVRDTRKKTGEISSDIKVILSTDFSTLAYVYVVKSNFSAEKQALELETEEADD
ncbi:rod shape-determining protein MreC [Paradesertivirga mongoliensis]|uniref:Cell shape-determining protein MreC n=1 Tax=Paradesertivirga mongoliensis TaxID=2100740 RepID=A0ABW4ZKI4_9SPHI|nr:rod shape-determining protein MreC [Pedobacter mongoliensis]